MIREYSIRSGAAGTQQTLQVMADLARQGATHSLIRQAGLNMYADQVDSYIRGIWRFVREEDEVLRSVETQVSNFYRYGALIGDCDDAAIIAGAIALAKSSKNGFRPQFVAVRPLIQPEFQHVYTEWGPFRIDPTAPPSADYTNWERMVYPL